MLLSVNLPDAESDALVGKKTLVVRFGKAKISRLYITLLIMTYSILPLLVTAGLPVKVALVVALPFPLAIYLIGLIIKKNTDFSRLAFFSIGLLMATAVFEALVLVIL
jgi:1,4-dihydroxy-2-naphthoate octaprenyltransferase